MTIVLLSLSAVYDRITQGRIHPVSQWGALLLFVWFTVWNAVIIPSAAEERFAMWLIR